MSNKATSFLFFTIFLTNTISLSIKKDESQHLFLEDEFHITLKEILQQSQFINKLQVKTSDQISFDFPKLQETIKNSHIWINERREAIPTPDIKISKIIDKSHFGNYIGLLAIDENEYDHVILSEIVKGDEINTLKITSRIWKFGLSSFSCKKMTMDQNQVYAICFNNQFSEFQLCKLDYIKDQNVCKLQTFPKDLNFKAEKPDLELSKNEKGESILQVYFENSKTDYLKNRVFIFLEENILDIVINIDKFTLTEAKILKNNSKLKLFELLLLGKVNEESQLILYKLEAGLAEREKNINSKILKKGLKWFVLFKNQLFMEVDNKDFIQLMKMDMDSKEEIEAFKEKGEKFGEFYLGKNVAVFEIHSSENKKKFYYYDSSSQRFAEVDFEQNDLEILSLYERDFMLHFDLQNKEWKTDLVNSNKDFIFKAKDSKPAPNQGIQFFYNEEKIGEINLTFEKFDENFQKDKIELLQFGNQKRTVKIDHFNNANVSADVPISFFDQYTLEREDFLNEISCYIQQMILHKSNLIVLCTSKQIAIYEFQFYKNENQKKLVRISKIKNFYPLDMESHKFNVLEVNQMKLFYEASLVMKTKDGKLFQLSLRDKLIQLSQLEIDQSFQHCEFNNQGLVCKNGEENVFLSLGLKEEKLYVIKALYLQGFDPKTKYMNSMYNSDYYIYLYQDPFNPGYTLRANGDVCDLEINNLQKITETTNLVEITNGNYLLYDFEKSQEIIGIKEHSLIQYPKEFINFKKFLFMRTCPNDTSFLLFYKSAEDKTRASLYNSIYNESKRLIQDFQVGSCSQEEIAEVENLDESTLSIFYFCKDDNKFKIFSWNKNGPLITLDKNETQQIQLTKPTKNATIIIEIKNQKPTFNFDAEITNLKGDSNDTTYDLEKNIKIKGDYQKAEARPEEGLEFIPRLSLQKSVDVISDSNFVNSNINPELTKGKDGPILVYQNMLVTLNKNMELSNVHNCKKITLSYGQENFNFDKVFICRQKYNHDFALTDFDKFFFVIDSEKFETNLELNKTYLMYLKDIFYLTMSFGENHEMVVIFKITFNSEKVISSEIIYRFNMNANNMTSGEAISDYFTSYHSEQQKLLFFFYQRFSQAILVVEFSPKTREVDYKEDLILQDSKDFQITSLAFYHKDELGCFYSTQNFLFEVSFKKKTNWQIEKIQEWKIPLGQTAQHGRISFSQNFVALMINKNNCNFNAMIWKRNNPDDLNVFAVLGKNELVEEDITPYHIIDVVIDQNEKENFVYVAYYQKQINEIDNPLQYVQFNLVSFRLGNMMLKYQAEKVETSKDLVLLFTAVGINEQIQKIITVERQSKSHLLLFLLIGLILLAFILVFMIYSMKKNNEILKEELKKDLQARDLKDNVIQVN